MTAERRIEELTSQVKKIAPEMRVIDRRIVVDGLIAYAIKTLMETPAMANIIQFAVVHQQERRKKNGN